MTCSGIQFVELLKKIGYPDAETLDPLSFDWMFEKKELVPFLETLCFDVHDETYLSADDLDDYKEFQANEFLTISLIENGLDHDSASNEDKEKENAELKEDIAEAEKYIEKLEIQKSNLTIHELEIIGMSKELEGQKKDIEKEITNIKSKTLPVAIKKFVDAVDSSVLLIQELDLFLAQQPTKNVEKPSKVFFNVIIQDFLDKEMNLLEIIHMYLSDSFKQFVGKVNDSLIEDVSDKFSQDVSVKELQTKQAAEALHLQMVMQTTAENCFRSVLEKGRMESQIHFFNELADEHDLSTRNIPVVQLQSKLKKLQRTVEQIEEEEERMQDALQKAIRENLKTQYEWVAILCSKEKLNRYKVYLELLKAPLDVIYEQRARLNFLTAALTIEENILKGIENCVFTCKEQLQREATEIQIRLNHYAEQSKKPPKDTNFVSEGSVLFIFNEIMSALACKGSDTDRLYLTTSDVIEKAKHLKLQEKSVIDQSSHVFQEQLQLLEAVEISLAMHDKYVHGDEQDFEDHPSFIAERFIMNLGSLSMKLQVFEELFLKERNKFLSKKEMISKNSNIALSRRLFVYALNNKSKLRRAIKEIKDRVARYEQRQRANKGVNEF